MNNKNDDAMKKTLAIFKDIVGNKADLLDGGRAATELMDVIADTLRSEFGKEKAKEIAFHLADWNSDSAFITALHLFPEKFTKEEIEDGIMQFVIHAPYHIIKAAELLDYPIDNIFKEENE